MGQQDIAASLMHRLMHRICQLPVYHTWQVKRQDLVKVLDSRPAMKDGKCTVRFRVEDVSRKHQVGLTLEAHRAHTHSDTCRANAAASMPCWPPFSDVCARYAHRVADSRNTCTPRAKDKLALHWRPHVNDPSFIVWNTVFFWHPAEPAV